MTPAQTLDAYGHWMSESWAAWLPPEYSYLYGIAQIQAESAGDKMARSPKGALGIAQFLPDTWGDVKEALDFPSFASPLDPQYAISGFCWYLGRLVKQWNPATRTPLDRLKLAQSSYNAGLGTVIAAQHRAGDVADYAGISVQLPSETVAYVSAIGRYYLELTA